MYPIRGPKYELIKDILLQKLLKMVKICISVANSVKCFITKSIYRLDFDSSLVVFNFIAFLLDLFVRFLFFFLQWIFNSLKDLGFVMPCYSSWMEIWDNKPMKDKIMRLMLRQVLSFFHLFLIGLFSEIRMFRWSWIRMFER